eukprot:6493338-Prorocentrum_lima.AAC.1
MTSSLVGSEMCIRDRDNAAALARQKKGTVKKLLLQRKTRFCSAHQIAVSYTHLTLPTICSV